MSKSIVIAVDGTAASGKGTLAKKLAAHFGFAHLDSGALYRLTALGGAGGQGRSPESRPMPCAAPSPSIFPGGRSGHPHRCGRPGGLPGRRHSARCARPCWISSAASCASPPGGSPGAVMDGRDIGTVICPDATAKLYVDARPELRAHRRWLELKGMGIRAGRGRTCWRNSTPGTPPTNPARFRP